MDFRPLRIGLPLLAVAGFLALPACSDSTSPGTPPSGPAGVESYPAVPAPSGPNDFDVPDRSEAFTLISPIAGKDVDFAPTWTQGTFTWDIDIQTQYEQLVDLLTWVPWADPPANYWSGTRHNTGLVFEGGVVDLREPYPYPGDLLHDPGRGMPRRLLLIRDGAPLAEPYNPDVDPDDFYFDFGPDWGSPDVRFDPGIFKAVWDLEVEPGFGQRNKKRLYWVAITAAPPLTNPVFLLRERFWERVLVNGTKSVRVDPGTSYAVSYTRTRGTALARSTEFAETCGFEGTATPGDVGPTVSYSVSETFSRETVITEEVSEGVTREVGGMEGKTIIFSVWQTVERYTFVDERGEPYTDPNYTFEELGELVIRGDHEALQSAIFDLEPAGGQ